MGYVESAAYFCAASETVANFANAKGACPPHPLEHKALTLPWIPDPEAAGIVTPKEEAMMVAQFATLSDHDIQSCVNYVDVYVGDFIALCQGTPAMCTASTQMLFHCINAVFQPNDTDNIVQHKNLTASKSSCAATPVSLTLKHCSVGWSTTSQTQSTLPRPRQKNPLP